MPTLFEMDLGEEEEVATSALPAPSAGIRASGNGRMSASIRQQLSGELPDIKPNPPPPNETRPIDAAGLAQPSWARRSQPGYSSADEQPPGFALSSRDLPGARGPSAGDPGLLELLMSPIDDEDREELSRTLQSVTDTAKEFVRWSRPAIDDVASTLEITELVNLFKSANDAFASGGFAWDRPLASGSGSMGRTVATSGIGSLEPDQAAHGASPDVSDDPGRQALREAIRNLKTVLQHPMSWFVLSLVAVGVVAVSIAERLRKYGRGRQQVNELATNTGAQARRQSNWAGDTATLRKRGRRHHI